MRKIEIAVRLGVGYSGANREDVLSFEVEDSATERAIDEIALEVFNDWSDMWLDTKITVVSDTKIEE